MPGSTRDQPAFQSPLLGGRGREVANRGQHGGHELTMSEKDRLYAQLKELKASSDLVVMRSWMRDKGEHESPRYFSRLPERREFTVTMDRVARSGRVGCGERTYNSINLAFSLCAAVTFAKLSFDDASYVDAHSDSGSETVWYDFIKSAVFLTVSSLLTNIPMALYYNASTAAGIHDVASLFRRHHYVWQGSITMMLMSLLALTTAFCGIAMGKKAWEPVLGDGHWFFSVPTFFYYFNTRVNGLLAVAAGVLRDYDDLPTFSALARRFPQQKNITCSMYQMDVAALSWAERHRPGLQLRRAVVGLGVAAVVAPVWAQLAQKGYDDFLRAFSLSSPSWGSLADLVSVTGASVHVYFYSFACVGLMTSLYNAGLSLRRVVAGLRCQHGGSVVERSARFFMALLIASTIGMALFSGAAMQDVSDQVQPIIPGLSSDTAGWLIWAAASGVNLNGALSYASSNTAIMTPEQHVVARVRAGLRRRHQAAAQIPARESSEHTNVSISNEQSDKVKLKGALATLPQVSPGTTAACYAQVANPLVFRNRPTYAMLALAAKMNGEAGVTGAANFLATTEHFMPPANRAAAAERGMAGDQRQSQSSAFRPWAA